MKNILNPKWILLINTIPLLVLAFLFYGQFQIIGSLLKPEELDTWTRMSILLGALGVTTGISAFYDHIQNKELSIPFAVINLLLYIVFLYHYTTNVHDLIPGRIPEWMLMDNVILYLGAFLMPTLALALYVLVIKMTPKSKKHSGWPSFLYTIAVPFSWYLFGSLVLPYWRHLPGGRQFKDHCMTVLIVATTVLFLFFLLRWIYIISIKRSAFWKENQLLYKIPICIIMPLLGLALNNGHLSKQSYTMPQNVFGDFSDKWFYIIAGINGLVLCVPDLKNKVYRILLFFAKCALLPYTFYFLLVLLPFMPVSVVAIFAMGLGFLMLTPILLFPIHISEISEDFKYLKNLFPKGRLKSLAVAAFLVLPAIIFTNYHTQRTALHQALEYVYSPSYETKSDISEVNRKQLKKTLTAIQMHKDDPRFFIEIEKQPYLSTFYNWYVLDNLTLSNTKIAKLENIFFGVPIPETTTRPVRIDNIKITRLNSSTEYLPEQNAYRSWADLELSNDSGRSFAEYATTITLPEGAWICDYYLYVEDRKEYGILSEKKAAMWIYNSIRNQNRDPGLLYYLSGNKVAFKVFPFKRSEVRKTGIELIHREPFTFSIDDQSVTLGEQSNESLLTSFENSDVKYISASEKEKLESVERTPYLHFIIDASSAEAQKIHSEKLSHLISDTDLNLENAKVSLVDMGMNTYNYRDDWNNSYSKKELNSGFFIDRAIKTLLKESFESHQATYPSFVILSDSIGLTQIGKDYGDWEFTAPEGLDYYTLTSDFILNKHSLTSGTKEESINHSALSQTLPVLRYTSDEGTNYFIPDDQQASIIIKSNDITIPEELIAEKNWETALLLQAQQHSHTLNPERGKDNWSSSVYNSFKSKIMTPHTSYIVVENEAQQAMLKKKQKERLAGHKDLDVGEEDVMNMSEPRDWILILLILIILLGREPERNKKVIAN